MSRGHEQGAWLARLDTESANLRSALGGAVERRETEHALRLVHALSWYWILRGRLGEARRWLTAALALPGGDAALRAKAGAWQTGITILTGDGTDRAARIEAALKRCEQVGDPAGTAWAQWFLAHALCGTGEVPKGEALTEASLDGFRALGERWGEAAALADRSVQRLLRGDLAGAREDAGRSTELFGEVGDACGQLWSVYPLASVAEIHGDYERTARLRQAGLDTAEKFGLSTQAADLLSGLGRTALLTGDPVRAGRGSTTSGPGASPPNWASVRARSTRSWGSVSARAARGTSTRRRSGCVRSWNGIARSVSTGRTR